jgi:hypothetical protein
MVLGTTPVWCSVLRRYGARYYAGVALNSLIVDTSPAEQAKKDMYLFQKKVLKTYPKDTYLLLKR